MKKILSLVVLIVFLIAGFSFGQGQQVDQPKKKPTIFNVLGVSCVVLYGRAIIQFSDLNAKLYFLCLRDIIGAQGIAEIFIAIKGRNEKLKYKILGGWLNPYSSNERGFVFMNEAFVQRTKAKKNNEWLERELIKEKNGDLLLIFYVCRYNKDSVKKIERKEVKRFNIRKFIEENFKD